tara:strand:+ start:916 stop:1308 length:393 start_codon:yes stop_codon:yes gene_type:complete
MGKGTTASRRQKRKDFSGAGFLKIKNQFGHYSPQGKAWYDKMREDGNAAFEANKNRVNDDIENQLQIKLNGLKETWKNTGYNTEEISKLEEAWSIQAIKDKDTLKEDKKKVKSLRKEVQESFSSRKNAGN